jgi:nitric oxide reductase subunit B
MRVPGDTLFAVGAFLFAWFVFRLWILPSKAVTAPVVAPSLG